MIKDIQYLTLNHIYLIHKSSINEFGGDNGLYVDTEGKIESILSQQYSYFGYENYPSVFHKAAMLLYFFAKDHCFVDGNKRVAIQSVIVFLTLNGYIDNLDDNEGYDMTMAVAASRISERQRNEYINSIAKWLSQNFL